MRFIFAALKIGYKKGTRRKKTPHLKNEVRRTIIELFLSMLMIPRNFQVVGYIVVENPAHALLVVVQGNQGIFSPFLLQNLCPVQGIGVLDVAYGFK